MRLFFPLLLTSFVLGASIPLIENWEKPKEKPDHIGIAPELAKYQAKYVDLATSHGIKFKNSVSIGFANIKLIKNKKRVIGLCSYGKNFREIDVDIEWWKSASEKSRRSLMYHEMTHCYCNRDHDWGNGTKYPDDKSALEMIIDFIPVHLIRRLPSEGFYKDECPLSIMHPVIIDDDCVDDHWAEYEQEMFNRCQPY